MQTVNVAVDVADVILEGGNVGIQSHQFVLKDSHNIYALTDTLLKGTCNALIGRGEIVVGAAIRSILLQQQNRMLSGIGLRLTRQPIRHHLKRARNCDENDS